MKYSEITGDYLNRLIAEERDEELCEALYVIAKKKALELGADDDAIQNGVIQCFNHRHDAVNPKSYFSTICWSAARANLKKPKEIQLTEAEWERIPENFS